MKRGVLFALVSAALLLSGAVPAVHAGGKKEATPNPPVTIVLAAAASLEKTFEEGLIPRFRADYPWVSVQGVYDSSGRLQTQIEQGLEADIFMSAATRQMEALTEQGLVAADTVVPLLQNRLVLIKPAGTSTAVTGFGNITLARIIALGDPATTPAGQYAREAFINLGNWDAVSAKLSLGNNVTEVLNWVAGAGAEVGIVYATDAATTNQVEVIAELPEGLLANPVVYPVGRLAAAGSPGEAAAFLEFLKSPEALAIFGAYGFSPYPGP